MLFEHELGNVRIWLSSTPACNCSSTATPGNCRSTGRGTGARERGLSGVWEESWSSRSILQPCSAEGASPAVPALGFPWVAGAEFPGCTLGCLVGVQQPFPGSLSTAGMCPSPKGHLAHVCPLDGVLDKEYYPGMVWLGKDLKTHPFPTPTPSAVPGDPTWP